MRRRKSSISTRTEVRADGDAWRTRIDAFMAANDFAANTVRSYRFALERWLDVEPWADGWEDRTIAWKSELAERISPMSVAHRVTCVRSFLGWCMGMGYVQRNPMLAVKVRVTKSRNKPILSDAEVRALLAASSVSESMAAVERDTRDRAILHIMLYTGLRISGVRMLDIEDIQPSGDTIIAHYIGKGHVGKDAFVVLPSVAVAAIDAYLAATGRDRSDKGPFLIAGNEGRRISEAGIRWALNRRLADAGISRAGLTIHSLRHTAATKAVESGASIGEVQRMLDHQSPATTELYVHELNRMGKPPELGIDYGSID